MTWTWREIGFAVAPSVTGIIAGTVVAVYTSPFLGWIIVLLALLLGFFIGIMASDPRLLD